MKDEYGDGHLGPHTVQTLSDIERGKRKDLGIDQLTTIAVALGVSPLALLLPSTRSYVRLVEEAGEFDSFHVEDWLLGVQPLGRAVKNLDPRDRKHRPIVKADPGEDTSYDGAMPRRTNARRRLRSLRLLNIRAMELEVAAAEGDHGLMEDSRAKLSEILGWLEPEISASRRMAELSAEEADQLNRLAEEEAAAMADYTQRMHS